MLDLGREVGVADVARVHQVDMRAEQGFERFGQIDQPHGARAWRGRVEFDKEVEIALARTKFSGHGRAEGLESSDAEPTAQFCDPF